MALARGSKGVVATALQGQAAKVKQSIGSLETTMGVALAEGLRTLGCDSGVFKM